MGYALDDTVIVDTANVILYAVWEKNSYTVQVIGDSGVVQTITVLYGESQPITALHPPHYCFVNWSVVSGSAIISDSLAVQTSIVPGNGNVTIKAIFVPDTYQLEIANSTNGHGTGAGSITYGVSDTISAIPDTGYTFYKWEIVSGSATIADSAAPVTTILLDSASVIRPLFTLITFPVQLDKSSSHGSFTVASDTTSVFTVSYGTPVAIVASADTVNGYWFVKWICLSGRAQFADSLSASTTVKITSPGTVITAQFALNEYSVQKSISGNGVVTMPDSVVYGEPVEITAVPSTGYHFAVWREVSGEVLFADSSASLTTMRVVKGSAVVLAVFAKNVYTISYRGNSATGGTEPQIKQFSIGDTLIPGTAGTLTKNGYTFTGWNSIADGTGSSYHAGDTVIADTVNIVLYAQWTINQYKVTFNSQSGSAVDSQNVNYNDTAKTPSAPARTGYTFGGWFKESACTNPWTFATDKVMGNVTLFAKWTLTPYNVTFNKNDSSATGSMALQTITFGISAPLTANGFIKTGYSFAGWATSSDESVVFANEASYTMSTEGDTLYAKWNIDDTFYILQDAVILSTQPDSNKNLSAFTAGYAWTWSGVSGTIRGLMQFDLSTIPPNSVIESAELYLYHHDHPTEVHEYLNDKTNASYLQRITSVWDATNVTWNNQPNVTSTNQVTLPASQSPTQDYIVNVTALIQDMIDDNNFGMMLRLQTEEEYARLVFSSSDIANKALVPKLVVRIRH